MLVCQVKKPWLIWTKVFFRKIDIINTFLNVFSDKESVNKNTDRLGTVQLTLNNDIELALKLYGNSILRCAFSYLHSMADAEDIVQDTLLQLMKANPCFESPEHEKAWLLRVAINLSKNKLNSAWSRTREELKEDYPNAELDEDLTFVWDAVKALPEKYRLAIHLFYQEGYSTAEIASILEKKEATVRSLLHRGREILKSTLKGAYDFDD